MDLNYVVTTCAKEHEMRKTRARPHHSNDDPFDEHKKGTSCGAAPSTELTS